MVVWVHRFFEDTRTQIALLLVLLDVALGLLASFVAPKEAGGFRLSYVADFLRNDVLGKVLPFFVLYGGFLYAKNADIVIPGLDLEVIMNGAWVIVLAALGGSLLASLSQLGLFKQVTKALTGSDPSTPAPPSNDS